MRLALLIACVLASTLRAGAASPLETLEQDVRSAVAARERLASQRETRAQEAAVLADQIARLERDGGTRANRGLERRLQEFDRLASALDDLDRRLKVQDRAIETSRARFEDRADAELDDLARRRSTSAAADVAARIAAIEAARQRVRERAGPSRVVRPALDIAVAPGDGLGELDSKRALLLSERERLAALRPVLDREIALIEARLSFKRSLAREIDAVTIASGGAPSLIQRESDDLLQAIHGLERERETTERERRTLSAELAKIDRQLALLARELLPRGTPSESP